MTTQAERLLQSALSLPPDERAEVAGRLIDSLDPEIDDDRFAAWAEEIARRVAELDSGAVRPVPWSEARRMILESPEESSAD